MDVLFATLLNYPNIIYNIMFAVIKLSAIFVLNFNSSDLTLLDFLPMVSF